MQNGARQNGARRHETLVDAVIARLSTPTDALPTFGGVRGQGAGHNVVRGGRVVVMSGVTARDRVGREVVEELVARGCMVWYLGNNIEAGRDEARWDGDAGAVARRRQDERERWQRRARVEGEDVAEDDTTIGGLIGG